MKAFRIQDGYSYSQSHLVIAESYADAELTFKKKYPHNEIKEIEIFSYYVQISEDVLRKEAAKC